MALTLMTMAGIAGTIVAFEGLAALMEHMVGNPEADVTMALRQLAAKNQRRVMSQLASEQRYEEMMDERLSPLNDSASRMLTADAMNQGGPFIQERDDSLLRTIESRLGVQPGHLSRASSPQRMGDMSSIYNQTGLPAPDPRASPGTPQQSTGGPPPGGQPGPPQAGSPQ